MPPEKIGGGGRGGGGGGDGRTMHCLMTPSLLSISHFTLMFVRGTVHVLREALVVFG